MFSTPVLSQCYHQTWTSLLYLVINIFTTQCGINTWWSILALTISQAGIILLQFVIYGTFSCHCRCHVDVCFTWNMEQKVPATKQISYPIPRSLPAPRPTAPTIHLWPCDLESDCTCSAIPWWSLYVTRQSDNLFYPPPEIKSGRLYTWHCSYKM